MLHKNFICTCLTYCQQNLLTTTRLQTTTRWPKLLLHQKKQISHLVNYLHVLHLHTNDWLDNKPIKHAFKTIDPSSQACRKIILQWFFKDETLHKHLHLGDQIKFSQVNIALHSCLQQNNQPFNLITHTCSNTRKSSISLCSCISSFCMHFILQL